MVKKGQVQRSTNGEMLTLGEYNMAAVVAVIDGLQDVC
jgi:hypothetical protein